MIFFKIRSLSIIVTLVVFAAFLIDNVDCDTKVWQRGNGQWSQWFNPTPELKAKELPSQFYLCGFEFRTIQWQQNYQCNCRKVKVFLWIKKTKCDTCQHKYSRASGINMIYCSYLNWNQKIEKKFFTEYNSNQAQWRPRYMCPQGYYGHGIGPSFEVVNGVDLGFNGMKLQCTTLTESNSRQISWKSLNNQYSTIQRDENFKFIDQIQIKFETNGWLTGLRINFSYAPKIQDVKFKYENINPEFTPNVIQSFTVTNNHNQFVTQVAKFNKEVTHYNEWNIEKSRITGFQINAKIQGFFGWGGFDVKSTVYGRYSQSFKFNQKIQTKWKAENEITVMVPPNMKLTISQIMYSQTIDIPFIVEILFVDRQTGKEIGWRKLQGKVKGVAVQKIQSTIDSQYIK